MHENADHTDMDQEMALSTNEDTRTYNSLVVFRPLNICGIEIPMLDLVN